MRFLDGVNVTYVRKDEKDKIFSLMRETEKLHSPVPFVPLNSAHYGNYRIEFYETSAEENDVPTVKLTTFLSISEPIEWLMSQENQTEIHVDDVLHVTDVEILDLRSEDGLLAISVDQHKIYAFFRHGEANRPLRELVVQVLKRFFLEEFGEEFSEEKYELHLKEEITDYFI